MVDDSVSERRGNVLALALFAAIALAVGLDLIWDYREGTSFEHMGVEGLVVAAAFVGLAWFARRMLDLARAARELSREAKTLRGETAELERRLAAQHAEAERWRAEAKGLLEGLGAAIDHQFERWGLSPAEREIGLLLLKGLSHQEVADLRGVSERTVRQQARSLYKKAGLSGRADLAAYFLEDLLLPQTPPSAAPD